MKEHGKWKLVEMATAVPLNLMMEQEESVEGLKEMGVDQKILALKSWGTYTGGD